MPRACTVCTHPSRERIDRELVSGAPNRAVASLCDVSEAALRRHKANHLPASLAKAQDAGEVAEADDLLAQVRGLQTRTLAILGAAENSMQHRTALSAIREARSNLELLAKLIGELDDSPTVNILIAPTVQVAILKALEPHPQARRAVADALGVLEDGVA